MSELYLPASYRNGRHAAGRVEAVVYFKNKRGHLIIAHHTGQPTPKGYDRCEANTLTEVVALSKAFAKQQEERFGRMDRAEFERRERQIEVWRQNAFHQLRNPSVSQKEKDFIRNKWLPRLEAMKTENQVYRENYFHQEAYEAGSRSEDL